MGEPAGNLGIARRDLQALEKAALKELLALDVVLEEFPNLSDAPRQETRPGCGPGGGGTGQKGHVPADV